MYSYASHFLENCDGIGMKITVFGCAWNMQVKQKMLELQLSDLKLKQHEEKAAKEQAQMKLYAEQVSVLLETEKNLRMQLAADGEKFQQFQVSSSFVVIPWVQLGRNQHDTTLADAKNLFHLFIPKEIIFLG